MEFSMSYHAVRAWFFGKLPAHGDFVARGLRSEARNRLDAWLSAEMIRARAEHGEAFDERYDAAAPWRYAATSVGGVICASIDASGRRFPVLAGLDVPLASLARAGAAACEDAIFGAFAQGMDADQLWQALSEAPLQPGEPPEAAGWWVDGADVFLAGVRPRGLISRMLSMEPA
jgi:type VI secretion system protein ImpM